MELISPPGEFLRLPSFVMDLAIGFSAGQPDGFEPSADGFGGGLGNLPRHLGQDGLVDGPLGVALERRKDATNAIGDPRLDVFQSQPLKENGQFRANIGIFPGPFSISLEEALQEAEIHEVRQFGDIQRSIHRATIGLATDDQSARPRDPLHFAQCLHRIAEMHEKRVADRHVKGAIGKWCPMRVRLDEIRRRLREGDGPSRFREQGIGNIQAGKVASRQEKRIEQPGKIAPAATEIDDAARRIQLPDPANQEFNVIVVVILEAADFEVPTLAGPGIIHGSASRPKAPGKLNGENTGLVEEHCNCVLPAAGMPLCRSRPRRVPATEIQPMNLFPEEARRRDLFPVCRDKIFLAHAGVTALPRFVADAVCAYTRQSAENPQEFGDVLRDVKDARRACAEFIGAQPDEIALLGPTSLGLSLFANGLDWQPGDEVLCYHGDYPANVYPWVDLRRRGVTVRYLEPEGPGEITAELVAAALSPKTRLVALASAHFFTGYRIDAEAIGALLHARGILFSVDAIQTLGAFPLDVERAHVDFLSADAHKWMLGPLAIGIVYVRRSRFEELRPTLLGAWNVVSPNFNALDEIRFVPTAQRYEPGVLNIAGILGMRAALDFFRSHGMGTIAARLLELKGYLVPRLVELGFQILGPGSGSPSATSITTFRHEHGSGAALFAALEEANVIASLRHDREGREYLRFSPHCYNTEAELDFVLGVLRNGLG